METENILIPVDLQKKRLNQDDREILADDRAALAELIESILSNRRLSWMIVDAWVNQHGYLLLPKDGGNQNP